MKVNAASLKAIRERTGFTQTTFAAEVGIARPNYAHIEAGRRPGTDEQIVRMARVLQVPVTAIIEASTLEAVG